MVRKRPPAWRCCKCLRPRTWPPVLIDVRQHQCSNSPTVLVRHVAGDWVNYVVNPFIISRCLLPRIRRSAYVRCEMEPGNQARIPVSNENRTDAPARKDRNLFLDRSQVLLEGSLRAETSIL